MSECSVSLGREAVSNTGQKRDFWGADDALILDRGAALQVQMCFPCEN